MDFVIIKAHLFNEEVSRSYHKMNLYCFECDKDKIYIFLSYVRLENKEIYSLIAVHSVKIA